MWLDWLSVGVTTQMDVRDNEDAIGGTTATLWKISVTRHINVAISLLILT